MEVLLLNTVRGPGFFLLQVVAPNIVNPMVVACLQSGQPDCQTAMDFAPVGKKGFFAQSRFALDQ